MPPAPRCRKASYPAVAWRCCAPRRRRPHPQRQSRRPGRHQHRAEGASSGPPDSEMPGSKADRGRQDPREQVGDLRLRRSDRGICRHGREGYIDPAKVVRAAGRFLGGWPLVTTEAMVAELPKSRRRPRCREAVEWAAWAAWLLRRCFDCPLPTINRRPPPGGLLFWPMTWRFASYKGSDSAGLGNFTCARFCSA